MDIGLALHQISVSPQTLHVEIESPVSWYDEQGLRKVLGYKGRDLMSEINTLVKRCLGVLPCLLLTSDGSQETLSTKEKTFF